MRARELSRINIVVDDRIGVVGDISSRRGTLARIVKLAERNMVLRRTADGDGPYRRIVVASVGLLLIVCTVADPEPHTGFVERALVAAYVNGVRPVLCLTKSDLADPQEFAGEFSALGMDVIVCGINDGLTPLSELINVPGRVTALVGHSGAGRYTLVNRIVPEANREIGGVDGVSKEHHTSTQSVALMLPSESTGDAASWIISTPGVRSFGPAHVTPKMLLTAFPDIQAATDECPRGCTHLGPPTDPECALDGLEGAQHCRAMAMRRLLNAIDDSEDWELGIKRD